jgi:hypothetical protein
LIFALIAAIAVGGGCGSKPPYRVAEPPPPSAARLKRLGQIELAAAALPGEAKAPRVWIGVPDRRAEGAIEGAVIVGVVGAVAGGAIAGAGGGGWLIELAIAIGAVAGGTVGAAVGGGIGALLGTPGKGARRAAAQLRKVANTVDISAAALAGAEQSPKLAKFRERAIPGTGPGGILSVEVIAYGTRAAGGGQAQPFVALRTRLIEADTGRVLYQSTSDLRGSRRTFYKWANRQGSDFRRELEECANQLGRRSVNRALTPRRR